MAGDPSDHPRVIEEQLERCREAFESEGNFAALSFALALSQDDGICPPWIVSAVHSIMSTEIAERVGSVGRWWVRHEADLIDLVRADLIQSSRLHGFTWDEACEFAAEYFGPTPAGHVGPSAMMKSWQRVQTRGGGDLVRWFSSARHGLPTAYEPDDRRYFTTVPLARFQPLPEHAQAVREKFFERVKQAGRYIEPTPSADG
jgi:hypothetical protein